MVAKRAREIGRHTRLVAFNASIEAQRSGTSRDDSSSQAVAMEVRMLAGRIGDGPPAERQLWQLLHRHHVDALGSLASPADADRLRPALDGSLFTPAEGYTGPGEGVAPAAVALGARAITSRGAGARRA